MRHGLERLESLDMNRQRDPKTRDISESEEESPTEDEEHVGQLA